VIRHAICRFCLIWSYICNKVWKDTIRPKKTQKLKCSFPNEWMVCMMRDQLRVWEVGNDSELVCFVVHEACFQGYITYRPYIGSPEKVKDAALGGCEKRKSIGATVRTTSRQMDRVCARWIQGTRLPGLSSLAVAWARSSVDKLQKSQVFNYYMVAPLIGRTWNLLQQ